MKGPAQWSTAPDAVQCGVQRGGIVQRGDAVLQSRSLACLRSAFTSRPARMGESPRSIARRVMRSPLYPYEP